METKALKPGLNGGRNNLRPIRLLKVHYVKSMSKQVLGTLNNPGFALIKRILFCGKT